MTEAKTKLKWLVVLVALIGAVVFFMQPLKTCGVCGYQTLNAAGEKCSICSISLHNDYQKKEGYGSFSEMLLEEQTLFFSGVDNITLETPKVYFVGSVSYKKDPNWQPSTSKEAIEEYKKMLHNLIDKIE